VRETVNRSVMSISIVIPTLNEAACIAGAVQSLRRQQPCEIIVVDGGSEDNTVASARDADLVLTTPPGRAAQMNAGAARARGDCLLFLHADCALEDHSLAAAEAILRRTSIIAGCFTMRVQADGWAYRVIDGCASARVRLTGMLYGDQGLFLRKTDFVRLGGFPNVRFMEDVEFSKRLRRVGRVVVLPQRIFVSPRRWQKTGIVRQTLRNWTLTALALGGVAPDRLVRFYPNVH
jgi:rSAM/selenodomain-associated transferase 2